MTTRSWFIIAQLRPGLERSLGGEVLIDRASYAGEGRFIIENFSLRSREHRGVPAEVAFVRRAEVHADMATIWSGAPVIHEVVLHDVLLRVSEDAHEAGAFSFLGLAPDWERPDDRAPALPPRVELKRLTVVYGRHEGSRFKPEGSRAFAGFMLPSSEAGAAPAHSVDADGPWYSVFLREVSEAGETGGSSGIVVRGRWNAATFANECVIEGLELDAATLAMAPEAVRVAWDRMDLQGRVASAGIEWRGHDDFKVTMEVADIGLTLPITTEGLLVRYAGGRIVGPSGRQRLNVSGGTITLDNEQLELDVRGKFDAGETAPVPYSLKLTVGGLSDLQWDERDQWTDAFATVPFELLLDVQDFHVAEAHAGPDETLRDDRASGVDLPVQIAQMLEAAAITDWTLSMRMRASRAAGSTDLETSGKAIISGGSGAHPRFPYRLTGVEAVIQFDNDRAVIEYLTGIGLSGAAVRLSGEIAPLGRNAGVNLRITSERVPLDEHLRSALNDRQRDLFDSLLHAPSYESLLQAGLLPDAEEIVAMRGQRREIVRRIAALNEANGDMTDADEATLLELLELTRREVQLDAIISAGPFAIDSVASGDWGSVKVDMRIRRDPGPGMPLRLTGTTAVHEARLLVKQFPYPITITGGVLRWEEDRVRIVAEDGVRGLPFTMPGGGRGVAAGSVERVPPDQRAGFDIHIEAENDAVNDLVYAAIPLMNGDSLDDDACWPGEAISNPAVLLRSMGVSGPLAYSGRVWRETSPRLTVQTSRLDEGGDGTSDSTLNSDLTTQNSQLAAFDYRFIVSMTEGRARPTPELDRLIGAIGLLWPEGLELDRVRGELVVEPGRVDLVKFAGMHSDGRLSASGTIDLDAVPPTTELDAHFGDLTLGRYLIDLMPRESAELARELWERYEPGGSFNALLSYRARGGIAEPVRLAVEPVLTHVKIDDDIVSLHLVPEAPAEEHAPLSRIVIDSGQVHFENLLLRVMRGERDDGEIALSGSYGMVRGDEALNARGSWNGGRFDSPLISEALRLIGAAEHAERYREFEPFGEFDAAFHYISPRDRELAQYEFAVSPRVIGFQSEGERALMEMAPESRIVLTPGRIELEALAGTHGRGSFAVSGRVRTTGPPEAVLRVSHVGELQSPLVRAALPAGVRDVLDGMRFKDGRGTAIEDALLRLAQKGRGGPWRAQFRGTLRTHASSLAAGTPFEEIDGEFSVLVQHEPDLPPVIRIGGEVSRMIALDQELTNVLIDSIHLDAAGTTVHMPVMRGESHGGAVWATAQVGVGAKREYDATIEMVGVSLAGLANGSAGSDGSRPQSRLPQGKLYGSLRIAGLRDDPQSRSGRGAVRAMGGSVFGIPLALQIINILQFIAPLRADLDHADAEFYIDGDRLVFERILFESTMAGALALQLIGTGEMNIETQEIRTQFRSRSSMLLLRDLAGEVSDQLYQIEVYGTLRNPKARIVPLPGLAPPREQQVSTAARQQAGAGE